MSDVTLLRTLTRKSKLRYGHYYDQTVEQRLFEKPYCLVCDYYKLEAITFTNDILDELGITYRIPKPGKLTTEEWRKVKGPFIDKYGMSEDTKKAIIRSIGLQNLRCIERKPKSYHQGKNHGR